MHDYLASFAEVKYQVVDAIGTGTCAGVKQAIDLIPDNKAFMLIWSDLILPEGFELPEEYTGKDNNPESDAGFSFVHDDGTLNIETNGLYETIPFLKRGYRVDNTLQIINDMTVYPASIFHPYDYMSCEERIAENTVSIHYFYGGWMDDADRKNRSDTQDKYKAVLKRMG